MSQTFSGAPGFAIDHLKIAIAFHAYLKDNGLFEARREYMVEFFFLYLALALGYELSMAGRRDIYELARDFVRREGWRPGDFSPGVRRQFQMLANGTLGGEKRRFMFGLAGMREPRARKKIYFLGVPVWRSRYGGGKHARTVQ
jgi:hypothetical protein